MGAIRNNATTRTVALLNGGAIQAQHDHGRMYLRVRAPGARAWTSLPADIEGAREFCALLADLLTRSDAPPELEGFVGFELTDQGVSRSGRPIAVLSRHHNGAAIVGRMADVMPPVALRHLSDLLREAAENAEINLRQREVSF